MSTVPSTCILETRSIGKRFDATIALQDVDFDLKSGEVHVLFGENGAGKSTLINLMAGTFGATKGELYFNGEQIHHSTPAVARHLGISAVFQEFSLVPQLTVAENIFLGREPARYGFIDGLKIDAGARRILKALDFSIDTTRIVGDLSRAEQQMVEIAKALLIEPRVLILDEPTASLTEAETEILFRNIARLKAAGVGIIYVSHRMPEIRALADRITVLRDGRKIATVDASRVSDDELVALMVGRQMDQLFPNVPCRPGRVRLSAHNLSIAQGDVRDASITLRAGEIVGVGGLVGCGKSEFVRALFGLEPLLAGDIIIDGQTIDNPTPADMLARKVCYFPADRNAEGLALPRNIIENSSVTAISTETLSRGPFLRKASERRMVDRIIEQLTIKPRQGGERVSSLSGGNRQKVMLARGLVRPTEIFLFDEPTVGIDVGAKLDVYKTIGNLVEAGHAVLLVSSDLTELLHLSHRMIVFKGGRIVGELEGARLNENEALSLFFADGPVLKAAAE
ncbi:sugar ABC transporter ATP-binding protein [Methylobacterium brachythecii]|uniref:Ribose transport system ATP-binding protein n=1 Tax=Methylobacterium brachythecii TaxID=1176177 RepID=A0A7W6F7S4_9HYPH|nr:sugar ABC transporter ATP-binding protein [Methylobacterium brachythecii]MBB3903693.1 ribose transport system ATP-binding protein [Methylobacterium brachythecii]GLS44264.1 sugar ABC transporter ATP-binding protein [Methylobacterium brachythecii]